MFFCLKGPAQKHPLLLFSLSCPNTTPSLLPPFEDHTFFRPTVYLAILFDSADDSQNCLDLNSTLTSTPDLFPLQFCLPSFSHEYPAPSQLLSLCLSFHMWLSLWKGHPGPELLFLENLNSDLQTRSNVTSFQDTHMCKHCQ